MWRREADGGPAGPLRGVAGPLDELLDNFARAMGWDAEGRPRRERLLETGLEQVAQEIP